MARLLGNENTLLALNEKAMLSESGQAEKYHQFAGFLNDVGFVMGLRFIAGDVVGRLSNTRRCYER